MNRPGDQIHGAAVLHRMGEAVAVDSSQQYEAAARSDAAPGECTAGVGDANNPPLTSQPAQPSAGELFLAAIYG